MPRPKPDFNSFCGKKFGRLTFVCHEKATNKRNYVLVICECGVSKIVDWENLIKGRTKSCGCHRYRLKERTNHPLYKTWTSMKGRCLNPNKEEYKYYGGRGVKICQEWIDDFLSFAKWSEKNGWREGLELDKDIKGNGLLYSPETCSWGTHAQNMKNRRKPLFIKKTSIENKRRYKKVGIETVKAIKSTPDTSARQWAKIVGVTPKTICNIRNGVTWAE